MSKSRRRPPTASSARRRIAGRLALGVLLLAAAAVIWSRLSGDRTGPAGGEPPVKPPVIDVSHASTWFAQSYREAFDAIDAARTDAGAADAWGELGMLLFAHQYGPETTLCLEQAARLDPEEFRWPYLLGLHLSVTDPAAAIAAWQKAAALHPNEPITHIRLGELRLQRGELPAAQGHFETAMGLDRASARALLGLARCLLAQGQEEAALEAARRAAALAPDARAAHETLAQVHQRRNEREQALAELAIVEQLPDQSFGWQDRYAAEVLERRQPAGGGLAEAEELLEAQDPVGASAILERELERDRRDPRVWSALARAYLAGGAPARALAVLEEAAKEHPLSAEVRFQQGVAAFRLNDFTAAASHFQAAIELQGDFALAYYNLGHCRLRLGDKAAAEKAFDAAAKLRPDHADSHTNLARLLLDRGDRKQAKRHLQIANRFAPRDSEVRRLLESID